MSAQGLRDLQEKAAADEALLAALRAAVTAQEVVEIAAEHGCDVQVDELVRDADLSGDTELSDDELQGMTGGTWWITAQCPPTTKAMIGGCAW